MVSKLRKYVEGQLIVARSRDCGECRAARDILGNFLACWCWVGLVPSTTKGFSISSTISTK